MDNLAGTSGESFLRWRISIEEDEDNVELEEFGSEQLLKTVVRTSYLYHLRQSLRKNLEASKQKENHAVEEVIVNKVIKGCSALLEEKALRRCMIAKLYQRVMAQTIKEVKKATADCSLYVPLKEFAEHQSKVPTTTFANKEVQTENNPLSQLADLYSQAESLLQKINPISNFTLDSSTVPNLNCDRLKAFLQERTFNGVPPVQSKPNITNGISRNQVSSPINFNGVEKKTALNKRKKCNEEISSSEDENISANASHEPVITTKPAEGSDCVLPAKNNTFEVRLRSPAFAESAALWYNLECEIEELPPAKKQKLEETFTRIFGPDHAVDYYYLTNEQKSIACRKRIAKFVVMELTTYYVKKKIASKQLFKTLAKHITSVLLGRSLYPSPEEIKRSVEEFFLDDRIIQSEDDFYF